MPAFNPSVQHCRGHKFHFFIPEAEESRSTQFEASLVYIGSSGPHGPYSKSLSQNKNIELEMAQQLKSLAALSENLVPFPPPIS